METLAGTEGTEADEGTTAPHGPRLDASAEARGDLNGRPRLGLRSVIMALPTACIRDGARPAAAALALAAGALAYGVNGRAGLASAATSAGASRRGRDGERE